MRWQFSRDFCPAKRRRAVARQVTKGKKHRKGPRRGGRCSAPLVLSEESVYCLSARVRGTDYASFRIIGNANRHYANAFVYCRFRRFIGDRTCVSGMKHFIRSEGRSASCAAGDHRKRKPSARRGVDRKAGRFLSPRLRVLLWSFLPTREESGVPEMIESTINNPANPQICRRWEVQRKRIAAGVSRPRGGGCRECASARNGQDSSLTLRMTKGGNAYPNLSFTTAPQPSATCPTTHRRKYESARNSTADR